MQYVLQNEVAVQFTVHHVYYCLRNYVFVDAGWVLQTNLQSFHWCSHVRGNTISSVRGCVTRQVRLLCMLPHGMHVHKQSTNETGIFTKILFNKVFNADSMYFLVTIGVAFFKCIFANVFRGDKIYNMRLVHKRDGIKYVCMRYISFGNGVFAAIHAAVVATLYCPYTAV